MSRKPVARATGEVTEPAGYADWLADIKARVVAARQPAALFANAELIRLYWQIGRDILERHARQGWGSKVIERLARDMRQAFPEMKGFSVHNLTYMRVLGEAWPDAEIVQQSAAQLPGSTCAPYCRNRLLPVCSRWRSSEANWLPSRACRRRSRGEEE